MIQRGVVVLSGSFPDNDGIDGCTSDGVVWVVQWTDKGDDQAMDMNRYKDCNTSRRCGRNRKPSRSHGHQLQSAERGLRRGKRRGERRRKGSVEKAKIERARNFLFGYTLHVFPGISPGLAQGSSY